MTSADPIPISLVAHTVFCARRAWLEAAGEQVESRAIEKGIADHTRVDERRGDRVRQRRSVDVGHDGLGLTGRCDIVDISDDGVRVVEFKAAPLRENSEVTPAQQIQLALQGMCLEDSGFTVSGHAVHFTTSRQTVDVPVDEKLRARAVDYVRLTRAIVEAEHAPPPLVNDPRCSRCSHVSVCLPDEYSPGPTPARRISVRDPEGETLHLTIPGSRASLAKGRVVVKHDGTEVASLPIERVAALVVHGNVDISGALIRELLWRRQTVVWTTYAGRVVGHAQSSNVPNGEARAKVASLPDTARLCTARELIASKIANQATQLRRSTRTGEAATVARLRHIAKLAGNAPDVRYLLGLEGEAASLYFGKFLTMFNESSRAVIGSSWPGRIGRHAYDPLNVSLNIAYTALLADVIRAVVASGLDTHDGFVHSSKRNKPALALDLMEQFRPVVADSAVLTAFNNGELRSRHFVNVMGSHRMTDVGRRALLGSYERRAAHSFRHPTFGYKVSWRRAMEVQARLVLGFIDGTQLAYRGIRTR